jgi:hypothetical protein
MKPNLTDPGKVIITIATTGGLHGRESNPALPRAAQGHHPEFSRLL